MPFPIIGGVIGLGVLAWVRKAAMTLAMFLAVKALIKVVIYTALPIILYNVGTKVIFDFMDATITQCVIIPAVTFRRNGTGI
jgi:hypothetical protein